MEIGQLPTTKLLALLLDVDYARVATAAFNEEQVRAFMQAVCEEVDRRIPVPARTNATDDVEDLARLLPLIEFYAADVSVGSHFPDARDVLAQLARIVRRLRDADRSTRPQVSPPADGC